MKPPEVVEGKVAVAPIFRLAIDGFIVRCRLGVLDVRYLCKCSNDM